MLNLSGAPESQRFFTSSKAMSRGSRHKFVRRQSAWEPIDLGIRFEPIYLGVEKKNTPETVALETDRLLFEDCGVSYGGAFV